MTEAELLEYLEKLREEARSKPSDAFSLGILCACADIIEYFDLEKVDATAPSRA